MSATTFRAQPLRAPLNDHAISSLKELAKDRSRTIKLAKYLKDASEHLAQSVDQLNEAGYDRRVKYERQRKRRDGEDNGDDAAEQEHEEFQEKVETLTNKMDMSIRAIVDDQVWLEDLPNAIKETVNKAGQSSTQTQQSSSFNPTPMRSGRRTVEDEDEDHEEEDENNNNNNRILQTQSAPHPSDAPHILLAAELQKQNKNWSSKTPTEKYAHHNFYTGFKRLLYDALHPGENQPPMPDPGLWFAAEEGREVISSQRRHRNRDGGGSDSEGSDFEIASETTRIKCPITLLPFQEPVTSRKCNHSYEKEAILDMLRTSKDYVPLDREQLVELTQISHRGERARREKEMQVHMVKCPECRVPLTESDLEPNLPLKRRVQRLLAHAQQRNRDETATSDVDEDEDDFDGVRGTQRIPLGLTSSPVAPSTAKSKRNYKAERLSASVVPQTQMSSRPATARFGSRPGTAQSGNEIGTPSGTQLPSSTARTTTILELGDDD
nr:hypothetical protein LTR18_005673 [Exophiala xenobiotica]